MKDNRQISNPNSHVNKEKDYSQRDVVDKLGICPGQAVGFLNTASAGHNAAGQDLALVEPALYHKIVERTGLNLTRLISGQAGPQMPPVPQPLPPSLDIVLALVDAASDPVSVLQGWKGWIVQNGVIWLLTPKRGQAGYVDQRELIEAGKLAGLVDNKVCSISPTLSAMRFVFRRKDRGTKKEETRQTVTNL